MKSKTDRLISHDQAVSEILGSALLLAIVLSGTIIFLLIGTNVLDGAKSSATLNGIEQAFTMADSRLSKARFSTAVFQDAPFKVNGGVVDVNGSWDNSHIIIYDFDNIAKTSTVIYNKSLGTIKCTTNDGVVAYQDGGVWLLDNRGGSVMLSPPDFDYNGITLTLPVMRINGDASMSATGGSTVIIGVKSTDPTQVYPRQGTYSNPVTPNHFINISIKSDYYLAWADYINERTRATATTDATTKTVNVSLSTGVGRQSGMAEDGFSTKSMDTTFNAPILAFTLDIKTADSGNNYRIPYGITPAGNPSLDINVGRVKGGDNKDYDKVDISYKIGTVEEKWSTYMEFHRKSEEDINMNFLDHSAMMYYNGSSLQTVSWGDYPDIYDYPSTKSIPEYDDPAHSDVTYNAANQPQKTLYDVIQHYMLLMAQYDQASGNNRGPKYEITTNAQNIFDRQKSNFYLEYASSQDLKYMYITEGTLNTNLASSG